MHDTVGFQVALCFMRARVPAFSKVNLEECSRSASADAQLFELLRFRGSHVVCGF